MGLSFDLVPVRLFIRLLLGIILWSAAYGKITHPRTFSRGIQEYRIIPIFLEKILSLSVVLAFGIPVLECIAGLSLIGGFLLVPSAILTVGLFLIFSAAIAINLVRGRNDLSCHCEGALGNHQISWWLVGRNLFLIGFASVLLFTPPDQLTFATFLREPTLLHETFFPTIVPVVLVVGVVLIILWLFNYARAILHIES